MIAILRAYANCGKYHVPTVWGATIFTTLNLGITPIVGPEVVVDMLGS